MTINTSAIYQGHFGMLYKLSGDGHVMCKHHGDSKWYYSHYSLDGFIDVIETGHLKETT